jgi:hypothetical protein
LKLTDRQNRANIPDCWQRSSVVEQGTHKPLVGGSNPPAATSLSLQPHRHSISPITAGNSFLIIFCTLTIALKNNLICFVGQDLVRIEYMLIDIP